MPAIFPLLGVLTHILDQNNTKDVKNIGVNNGYVAHASILNHHFNSVKTLCSSYESPFTAIRKKKKKRQFEDSQEKETQETQGGQLSPKLLGSQGAGGQSRYQFYSVRFSDMQNTSPVPYIPLKVRFPLNNRYFTKE